MRQAAVVLSRVQFKYFFIELQVLHLLKTLITAGRNFLIIVAQQLRKFDGQNKLKSNFKLIEYLFLFHQGDVLRKLLIFEQNIKDTNMRFISVINIRFVYTCILKIVKKFVSLLQDLFLLFTSV